MSPRPLSLGYYCPGWPPDRVPNGIVSYTAMMREALRAAGHRAWVLAGKVEDGCAEAEVLEVRPWEGAGVLDRALGQIRPSWQITRMKALGIAKAARRAHATGGLDLLELEESFGWAERVQRFCPVPVVVRLHGPWFLNGAVMGFKQDAAFQRRILIEGKALARARHVTSPSRDVLERTRAYYGLALEGAEVIPNPAPAVPEDACWRLEECDRQTILFVGRFDRHKGGDVIIDAFARLFKDFPKTRLRFVGPDGNFIDAGGKHWRLEEYVAERLPSEARERFEWLGRLPRSELDHLRRGALVTVSPSRYENYPTTVLEAKAIGCPQVASRIGGIPEMLRDGVDGPLCEPGDADDLATKLAALLANPERTATLGRAASEDARERMNPVVVAERMVASYRRMLGVL